MTNHLQAPVLLVGGSGVVGTRAARALRKLAPDLPLVIAGRDATKASVVAAEVGGPTSSLTVDLNRDDLALPADSSFGAMVVLVKDVGMRTMRYAQAKGIAYVAFSDFAFDIAPAIGLFIRAPHAAPILMLGHVVGGVATLAALHFAKELRSVSSIAIAGVVGTDDTGGPAARADFERYAAGGHGALVLHDGAWTWLKDDAATRTVIDRAGVERTAYALPLLDVVSLAAETTARSLRVDLAVRGDHEQKSATELIIEIDGTRDDGTRATLRVTLSDDDVHARISAYGAALATERLLGLRGGPPVGPGLYAPERILDPSTAVARLAELGVRVEVARGPEPKTMQAAIIDHYGGIEALSVRTVSVPEIGPDEILIQVEASGVAKWDGDEREGKYAEYLGTPRFPYVLGWEGAGTVVAVGDGVRRFRAGDRVYAAVYPKPNGGGFYAQYAAAKENDVALVPAGVTIEQAGVMGWDALTALAGLDDALCVQPGEALLVFGASGGVGHIAVQLAKRMGARVLAVASGEDGVALARRLGADAVVDGRRDDVVAAARVFAPAGLDAALLTAGGSIADAALAAVRDGGRGAYPYGVTPTPTVRSSVRLTCYDGIRGPDAFAKLHRLIAAGPFDIHVAHVFALAEIARAHHALETHFLGKYAVRPERR